MRDQLKQEKRKIKLQYKFKQLVPCDLPTLISGFAVSVAIAEEYKYRAKPREREEKRGGEIYHLCGGFDLIYPHFVILF